MFRAPAFARRVTERRAPEDSIRLRLVVLGTVTVAMVALLAQGAVDARTALAAILLVPVGFALSHVRRRERNTLLKVVLAGVMVLALWSFIEQVRAAPSVDDARADLASLFLWTQVIHSFDLPRRRDLAFSVVASMIIMAEAGSLSLSSDFVLFLVPYAALGGVWLYLSHRARESERAGPVVIRGATPGARPRRGVLARGMAVGVAALVVMSSAVFVSIPRLQGVRIVAPPFSFSRKVAVPGFNGGVVNPGLPAQAGGKAGNSSGGYPGFGQRVDLGVRWRLSDRVVMKVRATEAAFWRAQAYDTFDGRTWTAKLKQTQPVAAVWGPPIAIPRPSGPELVVPRDVGHI